jgi:hypothetical protein
MRNIGAPASSTTKTGRHDIAEILLKVALSTKNQSNQSINLSKRFLSYLDLNVLDEGYSRNTPSLIYIINDKVKPVLK